MNEQPTPDVHEDDEPAAEMTVADHIENSRGMADNLMECPSSEQHLHNIQAVTAQAIRNLCDIVEELDARLSAGVGAAPDPNVAYAEVIKNLHTHYRRVGGFSRSIAYEEQLKVHREIQRISGLVNAESWAADNVDGDRFKCQCGEWKPLAGSSLSGPSPYAIPICRECAATDERHLWVTAEQLDALRDGMGPTGRAAARMLDRWREVDPKIGLLGLEPSDEGKIKETFRVAGRAMILAGRTAELRTAMIYWATIAFRAYVAAIASINEEVFQAEMKKSNEANEKIAAIDALLEEKMDALEQQLQRGKNDD